MALFTLEEFENITADQRKKNKNTDEQYLKNLRITKPTARETAYNRKAQTTQSTPNRRTSGLPTEGEPVSEQEIYRKKVNTQPLTADSRVTSVETDNGNIIDVADIYGKNLFQTPNVNITEKLKKDLGSDYDLFASQGIQGGNNPEYIGAFGENFKTGLKSFGRNILNTVDAIKSNNTKDARLIQAIERARQEAPNNAEVEKGLQIAIKNQNPYEKQAAVEKQASEKVLQRRQKTRQENARNSETYGNLPGYGIVRGAGQLAGAYTPTIALNAVAPGLGSATYYTNAYGSAFAQSVGEGATYQQAKQYARLDTALEYARMHAFNVIRGLTPEGSLAGEVMGPNGWRKVADKFVKTNTGRYLFKKTLDVTGAGGMAVLDKVITPYLKRAVYDPDADLANMADVLNAFGGAALVTAVLGALNFKQEYNDINNGYRYTDTFTKDREDINKWFKGVDNLEDAKRIHNAYVKSYADVRNSADVDPARLAELQEIENAFTSLKAQLKNKSARRSMATNEPRTATETAAEPNAPQTTEESPITATKPQAGEIQSFPLPQGETPKYDEVTGERLYTAQDIRQMFGDMLQEQKDTADPTQKALTDFKSRYINGDFDSEVPVEIQATEKALQESGVKFSTTDLDNAISGRQATKRYETVATKQPITPKTKWRDKLNEIIRGNGDNKEEQLKQLKESVKSEPAKKAIQAEIDKISPNKEQVIKTGVQKNTYKPGIEKSLTTARSEDDTTQRAAARRMLTKRGINWQTGEEMPVKLTAAQVDKLSYIAERDKQRNYPVFSNNGAVYFQDDLLFELGKDGKVSRMLTSKESGQIINDPNTIRVAEFNYQDTVVPFNQSKTKITSEQPQESKSVTVNDVSDLQVEALEKEIKRLNKNGYVLIRNVKALKQKDGTTYLLFKTNKGLVQAIDPENGNIFSFDAGNVKAPEGTSGDDYWRNGTVIGTYKDIINNRAQTKTAPEKVTGAKVVDTIDGVNVYDKVPDGWVTGSTRAPKGYISVSNNFATYGVPNKQVGYVKKADATASESQEADTKILQNSDKVIEKDIENFAKKNFTKSDRKLYLTDNGYTYLTNGYYILRIEGEINEATIKSLNDNGYSFEKNERLKNFLKLTPNDNLKIDMKPKYFPASGDKGDVPKYVFKVGKDKYWTVNKRYFDKLNNPGVRFMTVEKSDDKGRILQGAKAVDENGDVVGFVLPIRLNVENLKEFYESGEDVKDNFFKKKAPKSKATLEKEKAERLQSQENEESIQNPTPESQEKKDRNKFADIVGVDKDTFIDLSKYGIGLQAGKLSQNNKIDDYLATKSSLQRGKVKKDLEVKVKDDDQLMTRAEFIEKAIRGGRYGDFSAKTISKNVSPATEKRITEAFTNANPNAVKATLGNLWVDTENTRAYLESGSGNWREAQRLAKIAKEDIIKNVKPVKTEYWFDMGDNKGYTLTKAEYDYAQWLHDNQEVESEGSVSKPEDNHAEESKQLENLESEESIQADIERIDAENKNLENELENSTDEPDTDESITVPTATRAVRYEIDEKKAQTARDMRSQRGYKAGDATSEYNEYLTKAEEIAKAAKEKNPAESERIDYLLNKYSQKIARSINAVSANESKYPAWFVSGPARYNVKKNDALMRRTMDLLNQRESYEKILDKIQRIGNGTEAIKSSDANAVEKLTEKLEKLKRYHSQAKLANAYYKKNGSLEGFHPVGLTREMEKQMFEGARWVKEHYPTVTAPFELTKSNAEIHRLEDRIKNIQSAKEAGNKEVVTNSNYRVVKNAEEMRLQYFFDGKPDREVINIMKSNGFKWSPKNKAWQRQLTANAEYVGGRVNEALNKFYGESKPKEVRLNSMIPGGKQLESIAYALAKQIMPKNEKRAGELADLLTEIIQNEDSAPVVKEKLNKKNFYVSPQIIKKIQSFYGYEGALPENAVEGEDPILFNIQKPIEPKGRMVKLGKKEQERYDDYTEFYGEIPEKKGGRREVKVPKKVDDENPNSFVSESAKTIMQSPAMTDEGAQTLKKAVLDGVFNYEKVANKEALEEANKTIEEKGYEEAYKQWQRVVEGKEQLDVKKIALGVELLNNAVNNNDASRMVEIASGLQMFSTLGAQITQFGNVWRDLTPNGRLYTAQTAVKYINQQQLEKINKGLAKEVTIPASLQEKLLNAGGNLKERERIMDEIQQSIADQLPGSWDEKLRGIRYLAMLGNPRTHIRNTVGNAAMIIPTAVKNVTGGLMEKLIPKSQRTKAPIKAIFAKKDVKKFINDEYEKYKPMIRGETKYDFKSGIQGKRKIYKTNILNKRSKFNSARLEREDELFLGAYFKYQYRMAMAARGLTVNDLEKDEKLRLEIANIAAKEAQTNTYRDSNKLASKISGAKRWTLTQAKNSKTLGGKASWGALYTVEEGLLPFTNTPMNILKKGIEYSPVGLAYGVENVLREVKKGNMSASQAVDNLAKGLTGTGLVALGFYLASKGWIKGQGSSDKKQRAIDDLKGEQKNSLQIGDVSYTIDWSAPAIMPVLVGANIYQNVVETDGEVNPGVVIDNLISMADTITDMSLLQGVNSAIKAARYSDNAVGAIFANLTTNYATQYIPTLSGQAARTLDPVRRNAYFVDKNKEYKNLEVVKNKSLAKIPGASMSLTPYIDAWGNVEQKDSRLTAGLENFFSPGYVSKITRDDPATNEVERLYHQTGIGTVVPKNPEKSITFYGNKQKLSGEQWTDYAINKGKMSYEMVMSAIKAPEYKELPDEVKAKVITDIYDYCGNQAKQKLADEYDDINFFLEDKDLQREQLMELGISPATVFSASKVANTDGNTAVSGAEAFNYLESREDIDLVQRMYMYNYLVPRAKNNPYGNISDYEDE